MEKQSSHAPAPVSGLVWGLAAAKLLLHLATAGRYGIFRDEMYGLACAQHLDWGYIDHPPGGILIAWFARHVFGQSLLGLRLLPALAGAALVIATGKLTSELGGGAYAQALAALAICVAPIYLIFDHWLMMNAFEPLIWLGCLYCVLQVVNRDDRRYWLGFGALAGVGLETKYSILFLILGILGGLALTDQRRQLGDWRLGIGLVICGAIALPNFLWQWGHGFPFLAHLHHVAATHRDVIRKPVPFLLDQMLIMEPATAPLWVGGCLWLLFGPDRRRYGVLGCSFLIVLGAFIALKGKNYYVSPVYPIGFAAGAVALEQGSKALGQLWVRPTYGAFVAVSGLLMMPLTVPILRPETLLAYEHRFRLSPPVVFEHQNTGPLPQYFADEFGWENMVRQVAAVYHSLSPAEQGRTAIFANNWGDAAAVDFFGPNFGLPAAISNKDSYGDWGPGGYTGEIVIVLNSDGTGDRQHFATVEKVGRVQHPYSRRDEWFDIFLCRTLKFDLHEAWPKMKEVD